MVKKLALLVMAVAAVTALAAPAFASAAELYQEPGHTPVATGETLVLTSGTNVFPSSSLETETELGTLVCEQISLSGEVTQNSGGTVVGKKGSGTATGCTLEGEPFTISNIEISKIEANSPTGPNSAAFLFEAKFFEGSLVCVWEGEGSFSYAANSTEATLNPTALTPDQEVCGPASISGDLSLETLDKTPVFLS
jgi:hypothetical protein